MTSESEFDIIFAGGGATACVIAGRLIASNPSLKILVVEGGKHSCDVPNQVEPCRFMEHFAPNSTTVIRHKSKPSAFLDGRSAVVASGHTVGGGSAVNCMVYARGARSDYDDWASLGNDGWSFEELLPLIRKLETYTPIAKRSTHGYEGPIQISAGGLDLGIGTQFLSVAQRYDPKRPRVDDNNDFKTANAYVDLVSGRRSDSASRYLYPHASNPNLKILIEMRVKRVIFDGERAIGIEYTANGVGGPVTTAMAKKLVVVSAGAFGSPSILERSGIGSSSILERHDIPVVVDLPGVGENYQVHLHEWEGTGKGKIATNGVEASVKFRPTEAELKVLGPGFKSRWESFYESQHDKPIGMLVSVAGLPRARSKSPWRFISMAYNTLYPESIGSVHISDGQDANAPLEFDTGFLSKYSDLPLLNWLYKKSRELARRMPSYRGEVAAYHPKFPAGSPAAVKERDIPVSATAPDIMYSDADNEAISKYHRDTASTTWHSLGTCAMKPKDQGGVVGPNLDVYGVTGLKVADLSICPTNVGNNTYSTALLIGEKAAVIIAQDLNLILH
ncbi:GMC oxidoreductase-domain-containing protein [Boletus coccyginus]|nr:GMC oxidoreductase-domain-containing protein [Boletus coccyginus]